MHENNLISLLQQQKKIINYLQEQHLKNTGYEVSLPQSWSEFLDVTEDKAPIIQVNDPEKYKIEKKEETETFLQALANLNLPQKINETTKKNAYSGKKSNQITNFNPGNSFHMIETLNLSNFVHRKFSRAGLKELIDSISDMRCLTSIILKNNGIDDSYLDELEQLFLNKRLLCIDLSKNLLDKQFAIRIGKLLKDTVCHLEWIDFSKNQFSHDNTALSTLLQGIRAQKKLYHISLDYYNKNVSAALSTGSDSITRLLLVNNGIRSMSLTNSKLTHTAMKNVETALSNFGNRIISLNFTFSFLDSKSVYILSKGLEANRTLINLNLSNNALAPISGIYLIKSLKDNITLTELNLSKNCLNNDFVYCLADCLAKNDVLHCVDISFNPIGSKGAENLLKILQQSNDTLESLGDIDQNTEMGVVNNQEIKKHLRINQVSKDMRRKILENKKNYEADDPKSIEKGNISEKNMEFIEAEYTDYKILKPILFTNEAYTSGYNFRLWNV